jgi:hypothetical protein
MFVTDLFSICMNLVQRVKSVEFWLHQSLIGACKVVTETLWVCKCFLSQQCVAVYSSLV